MSQPPPELSRDMSARATLFSFRGRISRSRYWEFSVLTNIASALLLFAISILFFQIAASTRESGTAGEHAPILFVLIAMLLDAFGVWVSLALQVKRLHDRGRTGWLVLLNLIPVLGPLALIIDTYFLPGKPGTNRYGPVPRPCSRSTGAEVGVVLVGVLIWVTVFVVGRTFIMEPFKVPSGSNEPTIASGDYEAVSRYAYRLYQPERGDVVVFINPHNGENYLKRIVGLPGDTVQVSHGIVSINGQAAQRTRIADYHEREWLEMYQRYEDQLRYRYSETLPGGRTYEILGGYVTVPEDAMPQDNTGTFKVPPGYFFAMGDNRDNSNDSRLNLGYVPLPNLVGQAEFCYFSWAPNVPLWKALINLATGTRWERMLRVVV
jgi:signal peptidase I